MQVKVQVVDRNGDRHPTITANRFIVVNDDSFGDLGFEQQTDTGETVVLISPTNVSYVEITKER